MILPSLLVLQRQSQVGRTLWHSCLPAVAIFFICGAGSVVNPALVRLSVTYERPGYVLSPVEERLPNLVLSPSPPTVGSKERLWPIASRPSHNRIEIVFQSDSRVATLNNRCKIDRQLKFADRGFIGRLCQVVFQFVYSLVGILL